MVNGHLSLIIGLYELTPTVWRGFKVFNDRPNLHVDLRRAPIFSHMVNDIIISDQVTKCKSNFRSIIDYEPKCDPICPKTP